jgi:anti-sigma factor RsiW
MSMDSKQPPSSPPVKALGERLGTALDRAARAAEPPDYDQLAAYADGTLDDVEREIVESWLDTDPALRAEVDDLRALRNAMSQPAAAPGSSPAAGVLPFEKAAPRPGGGKERRLGTLTVLMGAMAAAVIATTTWLAVRTARVGNVRPDAAETQSARRETLPSPQQQQQRQGEAPRGGTSQPATPQGATQPSGSEPRSTPGAGAGGAPEAVALRDAGGLIAVDAAGTVAGLTGDAGADPAMTQLVAAALTKGALPPSSATAGLGGSELTLMGGKRQASTRLAPLSPIATVVRSARPVFRWSPHPGASNYVVTIYGADFDQVMASPAVTGTTWTATAALTPGVTYQWQVTADTSEGLVRAPAPPAPDARFRVIDTVAGRTLDRDLARAGSSHLLKGLLLSQAGVLDEAEQAFETLRAANPDSKRVANLLARVRERRLAP